MNHNIVCAECACEFLSVDPSVSLCTACAYDEAEDTCDCDRCYREPLEWVQEGEPHELVDI
jgi:hypothetical protein